MILEYCFVRYVFLSVSYALLTLLKITNVVVVVIYPDWKY